jgi:hypothetical protein
MPLFRGGISGAAPLQIQLGTTSTGWALIRETYACGENALGSASRPTLSRPSVPGVGTGASQSTDGRFTAQSSIVTAFSSAPSTPSVSSGTFNLPIRETWHAPPGGAFVVGASGFALFYAAAAGGHTWTGNIVFEEL